MIKGKQQAFEGIGQRVVKEWAVKFKLDRKKWRYGRECQRKHAEAQGLEDLTESDNRHIEESKLKFVNGVGYCQRMGRWNFRLP